MTKQEVIQKAYGEHWELVENYTDSEGWSDVKPIYDIDGLFYGFSGRTISNIVPKVKDYSGLPK